jgi:hypothetical protein
MHKFGGHTGLPENFTEKIVFVDNLYITNNFYGEAKHVRPRLAFNIFLNNTNLNFMAVVTSLNLTSAAPVQLFMTVVDPSGNVIAGVATAYAYAVGDPTQDIAVVDGTVPADVDIHAVSGTGGTSVTPTANFVSTLLQADGITPVFSGPITGLALAVTNNIPPVTTLTPSLAFNQ